GRPLEVALRGESVLIGWGQKTLGEILEAAHRPEDSLLSLVAADWTGPAQERPSRVGAFWPGRLRVAVKGLDGPTPLVQSLSQGPPIVWSGWNVGDHARDVVRWPDLH